MSTTTIPLLVGLVGLSLGLATVWARLGRTGRAQSWATLGQRVTPTERFVLAVAPLAADTMILGVLAHFARPVPGLRIVLLVAMLASYAGAVIFTAGAPLPRRIMPTWFRTLKRMPVTVPATREKIAA